MELVVVSWGNDTPDYCIHSSWRNLTQYLDMHVPGWKGTWQAGPHEYGSNIGNHIDNILIKYNGKIKDSNAFQVVFEFDSEEDLTRFILTWS